MGKAKGVWNVTAGDVIYLPDRADAGTIRALLSPVDDDSQDIEFGDGVECGQIEVIVGIFVRVVEVGCVDDGNGSIAGGK